MILDLEKITDLEDLFHKFFEYLNEIWLNMVPHRNSQDIAHLMMSFCPDQRQYFMQLIQSHPKMQIKIKKIKDMLEEMFFKANQITEKLKLY